MKDFYYTVESVTEKELIINKSKFIATLMPVKSQLSIPELINSVKKKHHSASHHPYAFRVGLKNNTFRYNDDGEPSGSSGKPILEAIDKFNLTDVLCVVTRYFGGILLGIGGLRRAYFESAELSIRNSEIIEKVITKKLNIKFDYELINKVMNYLKQNNIKILENNSSDNAELICDVKISFVEKFKSDLTELSNGKIIL